MNQLGAQELRTTTPTKGELKKIKRSDIYIILDNVLDTYNVGAIFRLADAVGAKKVFLCGETETPPNTRIKKASVNTWQWIDWEYNASTIDAISKLKNQNARSDKSESKIKVIGVELDKRAGDYTKASYPLPIALVVGHESNGISEEVLDLCDEIVELPMRGINKSLNVMVSLGIVLYEILEFNNLG